MASDSGSYIGEGKLTEEESGSEISTVKGIVCKSLTESEASKCLGTLGKCESGLGYAYLELNVSKRGLTHVGIIAKFKHLICVDVSANRLTIDAVRELCSMKYLLVLKVDSNRLESAEMQPMPYLQILTLNDNDIRDTKAIRHGLLERLELNRNKIEQAHFDFDRLKNLRRLELRGNLLSTTRGVGSSTIVELYLAENSIEKIEGLETLSNVKVLHLRANKISCLDGFTSECVNLSYLNLRANRISKISELEKLACLPALETLVVLENPAFGQQDQEEEEEVAYRRYILAILPKLKRIDKDPVTYREKEEAEQLRLDMMQNNEEFSQFDPDLADD